MTRSCPVTTLNSSDHTSPADHSFSTLGPNNFPLCTWPFTSDYSGLLWVLECPSQFLLGHRDSVLHLPPHLHILLFWLLILLSYCLHRKASKDAK